MQDLGFWLIKIGAKFLSGIRLFGHNSWNTITFKDRAARVEIWKKYGQNQEWARRNPKSENDLDAAKVNANVFIAVRAISDAIKSLPVNIIEHETTGGIERDIDDNDHEANDIIKSPNPEHSFSDIVDHMVKSLLLDGNIILTKEKRTGPNRSVEVWPRDPRNVEISIDKAQYKFGAFGSNQIIYKRSNVIHIRDMSVGNPFWGESRINTIREEIAMDYYINRFNSGFFRNGAILNLMFTPEHNLTEDQHQQLMDAIGQDVDNVDNAFKLFINKFAGKFEHPESKHRDIAFLSLLKSNREKIFGVFGLPPFRGGVLEFANYANALAQDADFWRNTVKPILVILESGLNKQLLWPLYGEHIRIKFDLDSIPAIKGDETEQVDRLLQLKTAGVVSAAYVREQLNITEGAAPEEEQIAPVENEVPQKDEEEVDNSLRSVFKEQRERTISKLRKLTSNGRMMSVLCDVDNQVNKIFNKIEFIKCIKNNMAPVLGEVFQVDSNTAISVAKFDIEIAVDKMSFSILALLHDADRYDWTLRQLEKKVRRQFNSDKITETTKLILKDYVSKISTIIDNKNGKHLTGDNAHVIRTRQTSPRKS